VDSVHIFTGDCHLLGLNIGQPGSGELKALKCAWIRLECPDSRSRVHALEVGHRGTDVGSQVNYYPRLERQIESVLLTDEDFAEDGDVGRFQHVHLERPTLVAKAKTRGRVQDAESASCGPGQYRPQHSKGGRPRRCKT
jgi:hypothetical protein